MTTSRFISRAASLGAALALIGSSAAFAQTASTGDPATAGTAGAAPQGSGTMPGMSTGTSTGAGMTPGMSAGTGSGTGMTPGMSMGAMTAGATLNPTDKLFMLRSAQGDMAEIATSQMALKKSKSPEVKQLAQRLITDHSQSLKEGMGLATLQGLPSPKGPCFADQAVAQKLMSANGKDFDKQFMAAQEEDHENIIALYNMELSQGQDPQVKAFAAKFLLGVESHSVQIYQVAKNVGAPFSELRPSTPPMVAGITPSSDMSGISGMSTTGTSTSGMSGGMGTSASGMNGGMGTGTGSSTGNMGTGTGSSTGTGAGSTGAGTGTSAGAGSTGTGTGAGAGAGTGTTGQ